MEITGDSGLSTKFRATQTLVATATQIVLDEISAAMHGRYLPLGFHERILWAFGRDSVDGWIEFEGNGKQRRERSDAVKRNRLCFPAPVNLSGLAGASQCYTNVRSGCRKAAMLCLCEQGEGWVP